MGSLLAQVTSSLSNVPTKTKTAVRETHGTEHLKGMGGQGADSPGWEIEGEFFEEGERVLQLRDVGAGLLPLGHAMSPC